MLGVVFVTCLMQGAYARPGALKDELKAAELAASAQGNFREETPSREKKPSVHSVLLELASRSQGGAAATEEKATMFDRAMIGKSPPPTPWPRPESAGDTAKRLKALETFADGMSATMQKTQAEIIASITTRNDELIDAQQVLAETAAGGLKTELGTVDENNKAINDARLTESKNRGLQAGEALTLQEESDEAISETTIEQQKGLGVANALREETVKDAEDVQDETKELFDEVVEDTEDQADTTEEMAQTKTEQRVDKFEESSDALEETLLSDNVDAEARAEEISGESQKDLSKEIKVLESTIDSVTKEKEGEFVKIQNAASKAIGQVQSACGASLKAAGRTGSNEAKTVGSEMSDAWKETGDEAKEALAGTKADASKVQSAMVEKIYAMSSNNLNEVREMNDRDAPKLAGLITDLVKEVGDLDEQTLSETGAGKLEIKAALEECLEMLKKQQEANGRRNAENDEEIDAKLATGVATIQSDASQEFNGIEATTKDSVADIQRDYSAIEADDATAVDGAKKNLQKLSENLSELPTVAQAKALEADTEARGKATTAGLAQRSSRQLAHLSDKKASLDANYQALKKGHDELLQFAQDQMQTSQADVRTHAEQSLEMVNQKVKEEEAGIADLDTSSDIEKLGVTPGLSGQQVENMKALVTKMQSGVSTKAQAVQSALEAETKTVAGMITGEGTVLGEDVKQIKAEATKAAGEITQQTESAIKNENDEVARTVAGAKQQYGQMDAKWETNHARLNQDLELAIQDQEKLSHNMQLATQAGTQLVAGVTSDVKSLKENVKNDDRYMDRKIKEEQTSLKAHATAQLAAQAGANADKMTGQYDSIVDKMAAIAQAAGSQLAQDGDKIMTDSERAKAAADAQKKQLDAVSHGLSALSADVKAKNEIAANDIAKQTDSLEYQAKLETQYNQDAENEVSSRVSELEHAAYQSRDAAIGQLDSALGAAQATGDRAAQSIVTDANTFEDQEGKKAAHAETQVSSEMARLQTDASNVKQTSNGFATQSTDATAQESEAAVNAIAAMKTEEVTDAKELQNTGKEQGQAMESQLDIAEALLGEVKTFKASVKGAVHEDSTKWKSQTAALRSLVSAGDAKVKSEEERLIQEKRIDNARAKEGVHDSAQQIKQAEETRVATTARVEERITNTRSQIAQEKEMVAKDVKKVEDSTMSRLGGISGSMNEVLNDFTGIMELGETTAAENREKQKGYEAGLSKIANYQHSHDLADIAAVEEAGNTVDFKGMDIERWAHKFGKYDLGFKDAVRKKFESLGIQLDEDLLESIRSTHKAVDSEKMEKDSVHAEFEAQLAAEQNKEKDDITKLYLASDQAIADIMNNQNLSKSQRAYMIQQVKDRTRNAAARMMNGQVDSDAKEAELEKQYEHFRELVNKAQKMGDGTLNSEDSSWQDKVHANMMTTAGHLDNLNERLTNGPLAKYTSLAEVESKDGDEDEDLEADAKLADADAELENLLDKRSN